MELNERTERIRQLAQEYQGIRARTMALPGAPAALRIPAAAALRLQLQAVVAELKTLQGENIADVRDIILALRENALLQGEPEVDIDFGSIPPAAARRLMSQAFPEAHEARDS